MRYCRYDSEFTDFYQFYQHIVNRAAVSVYKRPKPSSVLNCRCMEKSQIMIWKRTLYIVLLKFWVILCFFFFYQICQYFSSVESQTINILSLNISMFLFSFLSFYLEATSTSVRCTVYIMCTEYLSILGLLYLSS